MVRSSTPGSLGLFGKLFGKSVSHVSEPPIDADHRLERCLFKDSSAVLAREYWPVFITTTVVGNCDACDEGRPYIVMLRSSAVPRRPSRPMSTNVNGTVNASRPRKGW